MVTWVVLLTRGECGREHPIDSNPTKKNEISGKLCGVNSGHGRGDCQKVSVPLGRETGNEDTKDGMVFAYAGVAIASSDGVIGVLYG